ncbi:hypothetical protein D7X12_25000 [Corallococcus sicarius]|uniref:Uncharacterized protein n=1 Tax=Corallococcus sicarius TaxID=2316726 RepID=A0A3A8N9Q5_9BACT|nr:hypothetical protein D7X12_25000 [Corallococcus sicarius]
MAILVGLMSVGLLAGCGGTEADAEAPVQAMRPPPCEYACELARNYCLRNAPTAEAAAACHAEYDLCTSECPAPL